MPRQDPPSSPTPQSGKRLPRRSPRKPRTTDLSLEKVKNAGLGVEKGKGGGLITTTLTPPTPSKPKSQPQTQADQSKPHSISSSANPTEPLVDPTLIPPMFGVQVQNGRINLHSGLGKGNTGYAQPIQSQPFPHPPTHMQVQVQAQGQGQGQGQSQHQSQGELQNGKPGQTGAEGGRRVFSYPIQPAQSIASTSSTNHNPNTLHFNQIQYSKENQLHSGSASKPDGVGEEGEEQDGPPLAQVPVRSRSALDYGRVGGQGQAGSGFAAQQMGLHQSQNQQQQTQQGNQQGMMEYYQFAHPNEEATFIQRGYGQGQGSSSAQTQAQAQAQAMGNGRYGYYVHPSSAAYSQAQPQSQSQTQSQQHSHQQNRMEGSFTHQQGHQFQPVSMRSAEQGHARYQYYESGSVPPGSAQPGAMVYPTQGHQVFVDQRGSEFEQGPVYTSQGYASPYAGYGQEQHAYAQQRQAVRYKPEEQAYTTARPGISTERSVSRASSRGGGSAGMGEEASVHSSGSAARILAAMGTGALGSNGKPATETASREPTQNPSSSSKGNKKRRHKASITPDVEESNPDQGPPPLHPDLRPGDTVTDPARPNAHGCPYCDKVYTGQHARSICRRHQMSKHGIELEVQVKKSRWDNNPNRPANEEEKHRRTLESKRRWAAKDRQRRRAEKLGLPMPESSDDEDYDMRSETRSISINTDAMAAGAKGRDKQSRSPAASIAPGKRPRKASSSRLRDISIPPQPTRRITTKEAARLAAMERIRLTGTQDWAQEGSSDEDQGEEEDDAQIQETEIGPDLSPYTSKQPASAENLRSVGDPAGSSKIHPAYLSVEKQRELNRRHLPYESTFPQIGQNPDTPALTYPVVAVPTSLPSQAPVREAARARSQSSSGEQRERPMQSRTSSRLTVRPTASKRMASQSTEEGDVFGSTPVANGSLNMLAETSEGASPINSNMKKAAPLAEAHTIVKPADKGKADKEEQTGSDNEEAAEILLAISASPAPNLKQVEGSNLALPHEDRRPSTSQGSTTSTASKAGSQRLQDLTDDKAEDAVEADEEVSLARPPTIMEETPSRPSRNRTIAETTPLRRQPVRSLRSKVMSSVQRAHDEFAVPELQPASQDPSSSVSRRHEDSPITPAELQPAADILPYRRGKPPVYGKKEAVPKGDNVVIAKPEMSPPTSASKALSAPTPTPKTSAIRSGLSTIGGYRPTSMVTPARPGTLAGVAASPADYTTFSSPSGLDLTHKLGLAPAPTVPESPTWLEMVRATPDVRNKRARPTSMESEAGGPSAGSPRKRVRV